MTKLRKIAKIIRNIGFITVLFSMFGFISYSIPVFIIGFFLSLEFLWMVVFSFAIIIKIKRIGKEFVHLFIEEVMQEIKETNTRKEELIKDMEDFVSCW